MTKLYRLMTKFQGETVVITTLRRANHGRYAVHSRVEVSRGELAAKLNDPEFQKKNLLRPASA